MNAARLFAITFLMFGAGVVSGCAQLGELGSIANNITRIPLPGETQPCIEYTLKNGRRVSLCYLDPVDSQAVINDAISPLAPIY